MDTDEFYRLAHQPEVEEVNVGDKRTDDWTSAELEEQAAIVYEFANLHCSVIDKVAKAVIPKELLMDIQKIGKIAKRTAEERRKQFMGK